MKPTHRPHSSSFLGLPYRVLHINPQKGTTLGPMGKPRNPKHKSGIDRQSRRSLGTQRSTGRPEGHTRLMKYSNNNSNGMQCSNTIDIHIISINEILNKMQEVRCTLLKLNAYWKATGATKRWKFIVYDATTRSLQLLWLETFHLTPA